MIFQTSCIRTCVIGGATNFYYYFLLLLLLLFLISRSRKTSENALVYNNVYDTKPSRTKTSRWHTYNCQLSIEFCCKNTENSKPLSLFIVFYALSEFDTRPSPKVKKCKILPTTVIFLLFFSRLLFSSTPNL